MRFIDVAIPKFGDDTAPAPAVQPAAAPRRKTTFRAAPIEEYNLDDNRSVHSLRTVDSRDDASSIDEKGEKFYEAQDDTTEVSLGACGRKAEAHQQTQRNAMSQISFEFSFQVGKLQASLYKANGAGEEKALADAVLEGFGLTFALRQYDMSVDLYLRNVTLAMIEQGKVRKPLLSSASTGSSASEDHKLVKVRYMKVQKDSPEFMTKHDGIDQSVIAELSTFKITVAPEPILALNDFIMTTFVPQDEQPAAQVQKADEGEAVVVVPPPSSDKIRVRVHLTSAQSKLSSRKCILSSS